MRIDVTYSSGLVESYRTEGESGVTANALAGAPDRGRGETSAAVLLRLRLDRLEQDGLRVDIYWYGTAVDDLTRTTATGDFGVDEVPELCLELGRVWRILGPDDMAGVRSVDVDGRRRLARIAGELVCLDLLDDRERYWVGSSGGEALVERVARIHGAIREANPSWDDERVAAEYGFPLGAYRAVAASRHASGGGGDDLPSRLLRYLEDNPEASVGEASDALGANADELREIWPVPASGHRGGTEGAARDGRAAAFLDVSGMMDGAGAN